MPALYDGEFIRQDLDQLRAIEGCAQDAVRLDAFLEQVGASEEAVWSLRQWHGEHPDPLFSMRAITWMQNAGFNLYRIRPLKGLGQYRILYAYDVEYDDSYALAVVRKRPIDLSPGAGQWDYYNYERDHPISTRVLDEYERLDLPKLHA